MKTLMLCVCSLTVMAASGTYSKDALPQGAAGSESVAKRPPGLPVRPLAFETFGSVS
jgi:hypothetical protein